MDYMFADGFLGTKAPFFMDFVTIIVALLPLLVFGAIWLARGGHYKVHALLQSLIYIVSVIVVGYFEYGVRVGGGFAHFATQSGISSSYLVTILVLHITVATLTFIAWSYVVFKAISDFKSAKLPGAGSSITHKLWGKRVYIGIVLTAVTGILVYLLLFVF